MSILDDLKQPFDPKVIHWRVGATTGDKTKGIALAYINARDAKKRLDDVMGLNWQCRYPFEGCCEIGLKIDGEWVWRSNGAGQTDIEGEKGRYSDAFKRAATMWGVGIYLYYLPNEWVALKPQGKSYALDATPKLPDWALPQPPEMKKHTPQQKKEFDKLISNSDDLGLFVLSKSVSAAEFSSLFNSFPSGYKVKYKQVVDAMTDNGKAQFDEYQMDYQRAVQSDDTDGIQELHDEVSQQAWELITK